MQESLHRGKLFLQNVGGTLFLEDALLGALLLFGCFLHPVQGVAGLLSGLGAVGSSVCFRGMRRPAFPEVLNAVLWGLFLGMVVTPGLRLLVLALAGGVWVGASTLFLESIFRKRTGVGVVLSLPFALAVGVTSLLLSETLPSFAAHGQNGLGVLLESLSVVTFAADPFLGGALLAVLLLRSRWLVGGALSGYLLGWGAEGVLTGGLDAPTLFAGLNYLLMGMVAAGGLFPLDRKMPVRFLISIFSLTVVQMIIARVMGGMAWLAVTLPFNVVSLCWIYLDPSVRASVITWDLRVSPERRWKAQKILAERFPVLPPAIQLPVLGEWTVSQGEHGPWTHQHAWAHAVDLVLTGADGRTHSGKGHTLSEFHAWGKNVIAPLNGIVETVVSNEHDLPPGQVNTEANWGNHVILRSPEGWRVIIAHLQQHSIQVVSGQSVTEGQWIGRCGNSGYSPEPHVHIHLHQDAEAGAATIPFTFRHLVVDGMIRIPVMPETGQRVAARSIQPDLLSATSYVLDQELVFESESGKRFEARILLAPDGAFRLQSSLGVLDFGRWQDAFRVYRVEGKDPFLQVFADALPSCPILAEVGDRWSDLSPATGKPMEFHRSSQNEINTSTGFNIEMSPDHGVVGIQGPNDSWKAVPASRGTAENVTSQQSVQDPERIC